jgi:beta-lactamase class A
LSEAGKPFRARQSAIAAAFAAIVLAPVVSPAAPAKSTGTAVAAAAGRSTPARAAVEAEIARAARASGGEVGVLARHLESGLTLSLNENEAFPMASTFKVAVAGAVLAQVDAGRLTLDKMIPVDPDLILSSDGIAEIFPFPGVAASVHNLLESMLTRSDNTATNVLTELAGGPAAVTGWLRGLGVEGMRIDADTIGIVARFYGVSRENGPVEAQLRKLLGSDAAIEDIGGKPNARFDDDPRDTATPTAMVALLSKIVEGQALSPASTEVLLGSMERCITGRKRLRGLLPPGTVVKDKTGTIGGTVNDVGIITLPDGRGRVVIAVYIKKSAKSFDDREHVIADVARSVYDYMLVESAGLTEKAGR